MTAPDGLAAAHARQADDLLHGLPRLPPGGSCPTCGAPAVRVGTDLQEVAVVAEAVRTHGARYLDRVYTPAEQDDARGGAPGGTTGAATEGWPPAAVAALAGRYAVKEAVTKVLRPVDRAVSWREVEVVRQRGGWCTLVLHGRARGRADDNGLSAWDLSFSHDGPVAVATVVAVHTCRPDTARPHGGM